MPGAVAGIVSGGLLVLVWDYIPMISDGAGSLQTIGAATGIYSLLVGFFVSLICIILVSLVTKEPDAQIVKEFEDVADKSVEI